MSDSYKCANCGKPLSGHWGHKLCPDCIRKAMTVSNDELREFTKGQDVFDAYKKYLDLEDMSMVQFAELVYPLITADRNALLDRLEGKAENYYGMWTEKDLKTKKVMAIPLSVIEAERRKDG